MKSLFGFVATVLLYCLCSLTVFAQKPGGGGGGTGLGSFPIIIDDVRITQPQSCLLGQDTGAMLINISISSAASLPYQVFVGWQDANGVQSGQVANVTQNSFGNLGQVLITGFPQGMTIMGIQVIPHSGGFNAASSAIYTSPTFPVTINTLLCITSVTPEQITQCNANNGKLTVVLTNGVNGTNYNIDLQNAGAVVATRTVICNNNTLVINDLSPITVDKIVITDNQHREANHNLSYSWQNPPSPQIISVVPTPAVCDGLGSLEIILGNATDVANNSFTVKLNGNTFTTNVNLSGSSLIVSNIPQNFVLSSVQVSTSNTLCNSNFYAVTPAFTYPITRLLLGNIIPTNPEKCNSSGSLLIYLQNGVDGRQYDVVLNNGTQILRKTLFGGALTLGNQNFWGGEYFSGGYNLQQVRVKDVVTNCEVSQTFSYIFQNPTFNITGFSKLEPQNQCGAKGTLTLKVPNSAGRYYRVKLYGSINKNNFITYYSTEQPYGNDNNELVMTGFGNGTVITGIIEVYDFSRECTYFPNYQFTPAVTFNTLKTNPEIIGTQFINPTSCNGTGYFNFFINTQTAYPAWNSNGEDVKVEIYTSQGYTSSTVSTNSNIYSPQYPNGTTISGVAITRLSTGCIARWDNRFTFQSPDLPVIFQTRQHNYTKCNEPMEIDIQLANPSSTDTYDFVDALTGMRYDNTRLADGWYHVKKPFLQEGYNISFYFSIKNLSTGCSNNQSGYVFLQKTPPLNITNWVITQPASCGEKGKISFNGYLFLTGENYELYVNGSLVGTTLQTTVNQMAFDLAEGMINTIELRGKNICTPWIRTINTEIKNPTPIKILPINEYDMVKPQTCGATGSFAFTLLYIKPNKNYKVWAEIVGQPDMIIAASYTSTLTYGRITVNNIIDGTIIKAIKAVQLDNADCKTELNQVMEFISPAKPSIYEVNLLPIAKCADQATMIVKIKNLATQPTITVNYTMADGTVKNKSFTPPYQVGNEWFYLTDVDFNGRTTLRNINVAALCPAAQHDFTAPNNKFPSPGLQIISWTADIPTGRAILTARPGQSNPEGSYDIVYDLIRNNATLSDQSQSFFVDITGNGTNVVRVGENLVFTLRDFMAGDKVEFKGVSFGETSAFCSFTLPPNFNPIITFGNTIPTVTNCNQDAISGKINAVVTETILVQGVKDDAAINNLAIGENKKVTIQYFDGLGNPIQMVAKMESPKQKDIVQFIEYDEFNRTPKQYLPYTTNSISNPNTPNVIPQATLLDVNISNITEINKHFRKTPRAEQCNFYQTESTIKNAWTKKPFAETIFEASPLNRALEQGAAGEDWQVDNAVNNKHTIKTVMSFNTINEVPIYEWHFGNKEVINSGFYAANTIIINTITDEHNNQVKEYKDKGGKVIMKKMFGDEIATTYYVYDDMDRLRVVLQPLAYKKLQTGAALDSKEIMQLSFRYDYDKRGRMTEKYVTGMGDDSQSNPTTHKGTGTTLMVYDKLDRLVASQTPNQRNTNEWTWVKYDALSRQIMTGLYNLAKNQVELNNEYANLPFFEIRNNQNTNNATTPNETGYTLNLPSGITNMKVLTVNYFDKHDNEASLTDDTKDRNVGKPISSKVRRLDTDVWERNEMWYDRYGRVSKSEATVLGISTAESLSSETFYRGFTPIVERTNSKMNYGATQVIINTRNTYDHSGRLKKLNYTLNSQPEITMAEYDYNELGQLSSKKLHKEGNNEFIQAITHQYNIRGWLTHINNNTRTTNLGTEQPLFGMELYYNTLPTSFGNVGIKQFNGNISATSWSSIRDKEITNANVIRGFTYSYDKMNRLITANFQSVKPEEIGRYSTSHDYDVNGNIKKTIRQGVTSLNNGVFGYSGNMDDMTYAYNGNRLQSVTDNAITQIGLPDFNDNGSKGIIDYEYDNNGNLTKDLNKKIESIAYNHLNLPIKIIFTGKGDITYTYNAAGAKLTKTVTETPVGQPIKVKTVAYKYGFLFENEVLKEFAIPEGRVVAKGSTMQFQYHYKDHLGNVRMTFAGQEPLLGTMKLTAEVDSAKKEEKDFTNVSQVRSSEKSLEGSMSAQITENQAVSSRVVKVLKGQKLVVEAFATFDKPEILAEGESLNTTKKVANIAANTAALLSVQDVNIGNESKSKSLNINILAAIPFVKNLFTKARNRHNIRVPLRPKQPKAFLEIAMYADSLQTELLSSRKIEITEKGEIFWEKLQDSLVLETDGFAVVSLKNNSDIPVLFDNLELRTYGTQKARIIQENHYEPFGMTLQGLDYVAEDTRGNKFLYNDGTERETSLGLYIDETDWRGYNMQTGRFEQVDVLAELDYHLTPFRYAYNNPIIYHDPTGLWELNKDKTGYTTTNVKEIEQFMAALKQAGNRPEVVMGEEGNKENELFRVLGDSPVVSIFYGKSRPNENNGQTAVETSDYQVLQAKGTDTDFGMLGMILGMAGGLADYASHVREQAMKNGIWFDDLDNRHTKIPKNTNKTLWQQYSKYGNNVKSFRNFGRAMGGLGAVITVAGAGADIASGKFNTSNAIDLAINGIIIGAAFFPPTAVAAIGVGVVYGIYRATPLAKTADAWIDDKIGFK